MVKTFKESISGLIISISMLLLGSAMKSASTKLGSSVNVFALLGTVMEFLGVLILMLALSLLSLSIINSITTSIHGKRGIRNRSR